MALIKLRKVTFTEIHTKLRPHLLTFLLIEPPHMHCNRQQLLLVQIPSMESSFSSPSSSSTQWRTQRVRGYPPHPYKTPTQTVLPIPPHDQLHLQPQSLSSPTKQPYTSIRRHTLPGHVPSSSLPQGKRRLIRHCLPSPQARLSTQLIRRG